MSAGNKMTTKEECNFAKKRKFFTLVLIQMEQHFANMWQMSHLFPFSTMEMKRIFLHVSYSIYWILINILISSGPDEETISPKLCFSAHLYLRLTKFYNIVGEYTYFSHDRRSQNNVWVAWRRRESGVKMNVEFRIMWRGYGWFRKD